MGKQICECCMGGHEGPCCPGWFRNSETNQIERCDDCKVFATDDAAARHASAPFFCQTEGHETYHAAVKIPLMDRAAPGDDFEYFCFDCARKLDLIKVKLVSPALYAFQYSEITTPHGTFKVGDSVRPTVWANHPDMTIVSLYAMPSGAVSVTLASQRDGNKADTRTVNETQIRKPDTEVKLRVHFDACYDGTCLVCRGVEPDADTTLAALLDTATNGLELFATDVADLRALTVGASRLVVGLRTAPCRVERTA